MGEGTPIPVSGYEATVEDEGLGPGIVEPTITFG